MKPELEEALQPARIIPIAGIKGRREQEQRATSALLSVIEAVPPLAKSILADLGAPRGTVHSYIEVPLRTEARRTVYPDGAIVAARGKRRWNLAPIRPRAAGAKTIDVPSTRARRDDA